MQFDGNYQCDPNHIKPGSTGRGVTTWELSNPFQIGPGATHLESFTCTVPKCYFNDTRYPADRYGQDSCNVTFSAYANTTSSQNDIELSYKVNGHPCGGCRISRQQGHGGWQSFDVSQCQDPITHANYYNDIALNSFEITNHSDVTVTVQYFRVLRIYKMCNLTAEQQGYCDGQPGHCSLGRSVGNSGTMDFARVDKPCNFESCGLWSVTLASDKTYLNYILQPGASLDWYFDWKPYSQYNYMHQQKCLFSFNQIWAYNDTTNNDVQLDAYINDQHLATYYLSKVNHHGMFPSYDLVLNNTAYNDAGCNHVRLTNNGNVPVQMSSTDGINIYRVYMTYSVCGPYTDHSDNPHSDCGPHADHSDSPFINLPPPHYNIPHTNYEDHTDHSDTTHQDFSDHSDSHEDTGYNDAYHEDYADSHANFSNHSDTGHQNFTDHSDTHSDEGYYDAYHEDYSDSHTNFTNHSDSPFSDHSDVPHTNEGYIDAYHEDHVNSPHTNWSNHSDAFYTDWTNHSDIPHENWG